jgi:3'-phosphoadenosine 5'-phosphosulfate sulfotransferase (PAPS reductase)/FAD synthetase
MPLDIDRTYDPCSVHKFEKNSIKLGRPIFKDKEVFVLFSGGSDSLAALSLSVDMANCVKQSVTAIHCDTTIETPGNLRYVRHMCSELGVELKVLHPRETYAEMVERWGFPTMSRRWCKWRLKIRPTRRFLRKHLRGRPAILVDGLRRDESWLRRRMRNHRLVSRCVTHNTSLGYDVFHPVYEWPEIVLRSYIQMNKLQENPLYHSLGRAFDCWCTVYKSPADMAKLFLKYPALFEKILRLEESLRSGGSAMFDRSRGKRLYLKEIKHDPAKYIARSCSRACHCMVS